VNDLTAMALTLYGEARGEPIEGKIAVAMVIRNRVLAHYRGATSYAEVCLAKDQFSCWIEEAALLRDAALALSGDAHLIPTLALCREIAAATIAGTLADNTKGATAYYAPAAMKPVDAVPEWAVGVPTTQLGSQLFLTAV
jgi:N-acetylmuramoyl-L-alanine amidase